MGLRNLSLESGFDISKFYRMIGGVSISCFDIFHFPEVWGKDKTMTRNIKCKNLQECTAIQDQSTTVESSQEFFEDISLDELISFESQLYENRTFAIVHSVGKKIFNIIREWSTFINFDDVTYYHARKLNDGHRPFLDQEMMKAPCNLPQQGRYNAIGESCYYIAETKDGALQEIMKHSKESKLHIQVIGLRPIKDVKMIDLSKGSSDFLEHLRFNVENDGGKLVKEYLLSNFIASCCKRIGIEGIKYKSTKYNCCVLWKDDYFEFVKGSREIFCELKQDKPN